MALFSRYTCGHYLPLWPTWTAETMNRLIALVALFAVFLASAAEAKGPKPDHARKVLCNKGWGLYKEQHPGMTGRDRKAYIAGCMSGDIEPPVRNEETGAPEVIRR